MADKHPLQGPPEWLDEFEPYCPHHSFPLLLAYLGMARSPDGKSMAVFGCHCRYREGWGLDPVTGQPRRVWTGRSHRGRSQTHDS